MTAGRGPRSASGRRERPGRRSGDARRGIPPRGARSDHRDPQRPNVAWASPHALLPSPDELWSPDSVSPEPFLGFTPVTASRPFPQGRPSSLRPRRRAASRARPGRQG